MLPLGDDNSTRTRTPVLTYLLIAANAFVFFLELGGGQSFVQKWAFVPSRFLANPGGDAVTILTSMFMHGGWAHLLGNMLYLWIFGDNVEDRFGSGRFLIFYLLCGVAATFAQMAFNTTSSIPNLGASGAIAGVLGAYLVLFPRGRVNVLMGRGVVPMPALIVIGFWIVLQLVSGVGSIAQTADTGGVAYMAHVGGFIAGVVLTFFLRGSTTVPDRRFGARNIPF